MSDLVYLTGNPWVVSIAGVIADAVSQNTIAGARVQVVGPPDGAFVRWLAGYALAFPGRWAQLAVRPDLTSSADDGSFSFLNLPVAADPYQLQVSCAGYLPATLPVIVSGGSFQMQSIALTPQVMPSSSSSSWSSSSSAVATSATTSSSSSSSAGSPQPPRSATKGAKQSG